MSIQKTDHLRIGPLILPFGWWATVVRNADNLPYSHGMARSTILIGGISGGIGAALSEQAEATGWQVGGFSPSTDPGESNGRWLRDADATDPRQLGRIFSDFIQEFGKIDAYVHAIGSVFLKPGHLTSDTEFMDVLQRNLFTAFYATREAVKVMRKHKQGSIVLFSSVAAQAGLANHEAIAAAKGGVEGLVRSTAASTAPAGIRVNAIAPALVESKATQALTSNEQARKMSDRMHPMGRIGKAQEVANLAFWLSSPESSWVTGQVWGMDGGMGTIVPKPKA